MSQEQFTVADAPAEPVVQPSLPCPTNVDPVLVRILSWKRPYLANAELEFMKWLREEIERRGAKPEISAAGCVVATVLREDGKISTTMFSCHTDTVHSEGGKQELVYDPGFGHILLAKDQKSNCLGADDGAGVWLMLEMISAAVPGTYVFHRGEERGGAGSNEMLIKKRAWLAEFECAVAFDRPRDNEVITHQGGMRCASDKFAQALCEQLNKSPFMSYAPSDKGVFTDTRVYRGVIAECTNIGVGYENQHSKDEFLNYAHLVALRDALLAVQWDTLPIDRDPTANEYPSQWQRWNNYDDMYGWQGPRHTSHVPVDTGGGKHKGKHKKSEPIKPIKHADPVPEIDLVDEVYGIPHEDLVVLCESNPDEFAALLIDLASEVGALREKVRILKGAFKK